MVAEFQDRIAAAIVTLMVIGGAGVGLAAQTGRGNPALMPATVYGPDLFRLYCAPCHGRDGKGGGPVAPALKDQPADLTRIATRNGGVFPADRVEAFITQGRGAELVPSHGSSEMPVWGWTFRNLDPLDTRVQIRIANLVAYLKAIQVSESR